MGTISGSNSSNPYDPSGILEEQLEKAREAQARQELEAAIDRNTSAQPQLKQTGSSAGGTAVNLGLLRGAESLYDSIPSFDTIVNNFATGGGSYAPTVATAADMASTAVPMTTTTAPLAELTTAASSPFSMAGTGASAAAADPILGGTAALDTASTAAAASTSPFALSGFGAAGNFLAPAAGVGLGYLTLANRAEHGPRTVGNTLKQVGGMAASGALAGSFFPGPGTVIGGVAGGLAGLASALIRGGRHQDWYERNTARDYLRDDVKLLDAEGNLTLPSGAKFNFYSDTDGTGQYEMDANNPLTPDAAALGTALNTIFSGAPNKLTPVQNQMSGYFGNALMQGVKDAAGLLDNGAYVLASKGITPAQAMQRLDAQKADLTTEQYNVYRAKVQQMAPIMTGKYGSLYKQGTGAGGGGVNITINQAKPAKTMPNITMPDNEIDPRLLNMAFNAEQNGGQSDAALFDNMIKNLGLNK